jgi:hypothetical protein
MHAQPIFEPKQVKTLAQTDLGLFLESIQFQDEKLLLKISSVGAGAFVGESSKPLKHGDILTVPLGGSLELQQGNKYLRFVSSEDWPPKLGSSEPFPKKRRPNQIFEVESVFNDGKGIITTFYAILVQNNDSRHNIQIVEEPLRIESV